VSGEPNCPKAKVGEHDWEVTGSSAGGHRFRCRMCRQEKDEDHSFNTWFEPVGMDYFGPNLTRGRCSVCRWETAS